MLLVKTKEKIGYAYAHRYKERGEWHHVAWFEKAIAYYDII